MESLREYYKMQLDLQYLEDAIAAKFQCMEEEMARSATGECSDHWFKLLSGKNLLEGERATVIWNMRHFFPEVKGDIANYIVEVVCKVTGVTVAEIRGRSQKHHIAEARQLCCCFLREFTDLTFHRIGEIIERDHSSVHHAVKTITDRVSISDQKTVKLVNEIRETLKITLSEFQQKAA